MAEALALVEDQILPVLRQKKYVVVKPNVVSLDPAARHDATPTRSTASSTSSRPRFKGPVVIAESSAANTVRGLRAVRLREGARPSTGTARCASWTSTTRGGTRRSQILDDHLHLQPVRLAARLLDPDAYVICATA